MEISQEHIDMLVSKTQDGDLDAFSELYDTFLQPVFRFVFFRLGDEVEAEDTTSEIFLKMWKNLASYTKGEGIPFSAWIFRIAHNEVIDTVRRRKEVLELNEEIEIEIENSEEGKHNLENEIYRKYLNKALQKIPKMQAEVLILKFFSDRTNEEIATIVGKSETAVRILQSRGLRALKPLLEGIMKEEE